MSLVLSKNIILRQRVEDQNRGLIGFHNLVRPGNVSATSSMPLFPASNMANPITCISWFSDSLDEQYVTIDLSSDEAIDGQNYLAIARHNLGSGRILCELQEEEEEWQTIAGTIPTDDGAIMFRFPRKSHNKLRLRLVPTTVKPIISVIYTGLLLMLQRNVYVGVTPPPFGYEDEILNGTSMNGQFLGRLVLNEMLTSNIELNNLTPLWYRRVLDPFIKKSKGLPFFYVWRPHTYPKEVVYGWFTTTPRPNNSVANGMMSIPFSLEALG